MEVLFWLLGWYLIGILSYVIGVKYDDGDVIVEDIVMSFKIGIFGVIVFAVAIYLVLIKGWYNDVKDKKIW